MAQVFVCAKAHKINENFAPQKSLYGTKPGYLTVRFWFIIEVIWARTLFWSASCSQRVIIGGTKSAKLALNPLEQYTKSEITQKVGVWGDLGRFNLPHSHV